MSVSVLKTGLLRALDDGKFFLCYQPKTDINGKDSIGNIRLTPVTSYAQLASISTEVKKAAKKLPGSSLVINRRMEESYSDWLTD